MKITEKIINDKYSSSFEFFFLVVICLTIALGPIYWLPFFPKEQLETFKYIIIFFFILFFIFFYFKKENRRTVNLYIKPFNIIFIILIIIMLLGFKNSTKELLFSLKKNEYNFIFYSLILAYISIFLSQTVLNKYKNLYLVYFFSAFVILLFSAFHIICFFSDIVIIHSEQGKNFIETGFGSIRTGWSNGLSLFVIIIPAYVCLKKKKKIFIFISFILFSFPIFLSQLIVGGRAGIIASILSILIFSYIVLNKKYFLTILGCIFLMVYTVYPEKRFQEIKTTMFIHNIIKDNNHNNQSELTKIKNPNFMLLNRLSGYRLEQYIYGIDLIKKNPILGVGIGNANYERTTNIFYEIHNVFIKLGAELGIFFMFMLFSIPTYLFLKIFNFIKFCKIQINNIKHEDFINFFMCSCIFVSGLVISLLEPRYIFGGMSLSWLWWFSVSQIIYIYKNNLK